MASFAREIELDLLGKGLDIFDWHTGATRKDGQLRLSSRRLLWVIEALDDESQYKTARRGGDWSAKKYMDAAAINEQRLLRADQAAINGHRMDVDLIKSPRQEELADIERQYRERAREKILNQLRNAKGTNPEDMGKWLVRYDSRIKTTELGG